MRELLINAGIKPESISVDQKAGAFRVSVYWDDLPGARRAQKTINASLKGALRLRIRKIKNENWKTKHAKNFSIFALTKSFDVVPSWKKKAYRKTARAPIILDSINAFGTGLHETTSFMARLIEGRKGRFQSFLDIGTGTGLLALIALKCGAQKVCAIDIDEDAVVAARRNFKANQYPEDRVARKDIAHGRFTERFDFVAANLITRDLVLFRKQILSTVAKGGVLALSGIMIENLSLVRKAFDGKQLRCLKICKGQQWVALLYQRIA